MEEAMHDAVQEYGRTIKRQGWEAGEPLIEKHSLIFNDFKKWARALAMMLRTMELLEADGRVPKW